MIDCCNAVHVISSCLLPNDTEVIKAFLQLSASQATSVDRVYSGTTMSFVYRKVSFSIIFPFFPQKCG